MGIVHPQCLGHGGHRPGDGVEQPYKDHGAHHQGDDTGQKDGTFIEVFPLLDHERQNEREYVGRRKVKEEQQQDIQRRVAHDFSKVGVGKNSNVIIKGHKFLGGAGHVPVKKAQIQRIEQGIEHEDCKQYGGRRQQKIGRQTSAVCSGAQAATGVQNSGAGGKRIAQEQISPFSRGPCKFAEPSVSRVWA